MNKIFENKYIIRDINSLFNKLIANKEIYFHNEYLNSDGRKLFEKITRKIIDIYPHLRRNVYLIRRNPSYDNVVKLYNIFIEKSSSE